MSAHKILFPWSNKKNIYRDTFLVWSYIYYYIYILYERGKLLENRHDPIYFSSLLGGWEVGGGGGGGEGVGGGTSLNQQSQ